MRKRWFYKSLFFLALILMLGYCKFRHPIRWHDWHEFTKYYITEEGRVLDPTTLRTTSEGQSYAMFFALVANDRKVFDLVLNWTQANLTESGLKDQLPAWSWGENPEKIWEILDHNSASDADLWIAYDLIEAGRLWGNNYYSELGEQLLNRIQREEIAALPGLGQMVLPGKMGFAKDDHWQLNPSYTPPQLINRFASFDHIWQEVQKSNVKMLQETAPCGFSPDWVNWVKNKGWEPSASTPNVGGYDAIRVYLWVGMLSDKDSNKASLLARFQPMVKITEQKGVPPEKTNALDCSTKGEGPLGFSAAMLPMMQKSNGLSVQVSRLKAPFKKDAYFTTVLRLFGQGWQEKKYRFDKNGQLIPVWR